MIQGPLPARRRRTAAAGFLRPPAGRRRGVALIMVIAMLTGLAALAAPFVFSMILQGRVARSDLNAAQARTLAEGQLSHGLALLHQRLIKGETDRTPDVDDLSELECAPLSGFDDPAGLLAHCALEDEQGKLNLNTAPPNVLGNLLGAAILTRPAKKGDTMLNVDNPWMFEADADPASDDGLLCLGTDKPLRVVHVDYARCAVYLRAPLGRNHPAGATAYDGRAYLIARYPYRSDGDFRPFQSILELKGVHEGESWLGRPEILALGQDGFSRLERLVTVHSSLGAPEWGRSRVLLNQVLSPKTRTISLEDSEGFGPGTRTRIVQNDRTLALGVVESVAQGLGRGAQITFTEPLPGATGDVGKELYAQAAVRHPVNVNTAPLDVLRACFLGVGMGNETVDYRQAAQVALALTQMRPFRTLEELHEGFKRASFGRQALLSPQKAEALFLNATDPCNPRLRGATVAFCLRSYGSFTIEGTGTVNARNGVQLARCTLRQIVSLPSKRQAALQLKYQGQFQKLLNEGQGPRLITGPFYLGRRMTGPVAIPPALDRTLGWVTLDTGRVGEDRGAFVEHFENPNVAGTEQEGIRLSAGLRYPPAAGPGGFMPTPGAEMWYKPLGAGAGVFFDQAQDYQRNRVVFTCEPPFLVVRVFDAGLEGRAAEYYYPAQLQPGLWYHVAFSARSSHPGGQEVRLDGDPIPPTREPVLFRPSTRLADDLTPDDRSGVSVVDARELPDAGAIQIGEEIIEYWGKNGNKLTGRPVRGGAIEVRRGARMSAANAHKAGELVIPYGFSLRLGEDVPVGGGRLVADLGPLPRTRVFCPKPPNSDDFILHTETGKLPVVSTSGFPPSGFLIVRGEVIYYAKKSDLAFEDLKRGQSLAGHVGKPRNLKHDSSVDLCSFQINDYRFYHPSGVVQIEQTGNAWSVEWIAYGDRQSAGNNHYLLSHGSEQVGTPTNPVLIQQGKPPKDVVDKNVGRGDFRGRMGTNGSMAHSAGAKVIPVFTVRGPQAGDQESPPGAVVSMVAQGRPGGDLRHLKRCYVRQYAITHTEQRPDPKNPGRTIPVQIFDDWGFEYWAALDDFLSRPSSRSDSRLLKFPSGEMPDLSPVRHVGAAHDGQGLLSGIVDEVKVVAVQSRGGRIAMGTSGQGLPPDGAGVDIELPTAWAAPNGANFEPQWPSSGLIKIGEEFMYYTSAASARVNYYADVFDTLPRKANRRWNNELHPNNNNENKTVVRLSGLRRGLLDTKPELHPAGSGVTLYDTAPVTVLSADLPEDGDGVSLHNPTWFPSEGYLWITGDGLSEVLSFTARQGNRCRGAAPYRGCFGTGGAHSKSRGLFHSSGALVRGLPFRYWDRAAPEYDGEGQAYLQAGHAASGAVWESFEVATAALGAGSKPNLCLPRLLVRFGGKPAWDSEPTNRSGGLYQFFGEGLHVLRRKVRADFVEVRVFWDYYPRQGARTVRRPFPPDADWKRCFAVKELRASYENPLAIRRVDLVERR